MKSAFKRPSFENIAHLPGVYIFKTALDTILYIGKARNLYKSFVSYASINKTD